MAKIEKDGVTSLSEAKNVLVRRIWASSLTFVVYMEESRFVL
jgi:hypothetical protein